MDNLVLTRVLHQAAVDLTGSLIESFRQESHERFRLLFVSPEGAQSWILSLRPERPWIGREMRRWTGPRWTPDPFAAAASRAVEGRRVVAVVKDGSDRAARIDLGDGAGLAIELATHGANLVVLDAGRRVRRSFRHARKGGAWSGPGDRWEPRPLPEASLDPSGADARELDGFLAARVATGESLLDALRRGVFGVGTAGAELVIDEAGALGESPGVVLRRRLDALDAGEGEAVVEGPGEPQAAAASGRFDGGRFRLLPWRPPRPAAGCETFAGEGDAQTAAMYYEAAECAERLRARLGGLTAIVRGEIARATGAAGKVRRELATFVGSDRHRRMGEALLAGLGAARREGGTILVPDPVDPSGPPLVIEADAGRSLTEVADALFDRHRRARRGAAAAGERVHALEARSRRLQALLDAHASAASEDDAAALEAAMRDEGLPVGLAGTRRSARAAALASPPRLSGVRMQTSADGWTILVGRTSRDNDRLTFKIAAPDDVWLHAADVPGAHVVIRGPDRSTAPPKATLVEAASIAAWFSDARHEAAVDVRWTTRKLVRRVKGGAPGLVQLKRFQTIRVRPKPPRDDA